MTFPPILTLGQAHKALGVSKTTISNRIKAGLPHSGNSTTGYKIQLADLQQRYPDEWNKAEQARAEQSSNGEDNRPTAPSVTPQIDPSLQALLDAHKQTVDALRETMEVKENTAKEEAERWKNKAKEFENLHLTDQRSAQEKAQALETALQAEQAKPQPKITKRKIGFFERLRLKEIIVVEVA